MTATETKKAGTTARKRVNELGQTYAALAKAQADVQWVQKSASNDHHRYNYVPIDMMVRECKKALLNNDLVLVPCGWQITNTTAVGRWKLHHLGGGDTVDLVFEMPVLESKGRAGDKAYLAAQSSGLKYLLRDLLMVPMLEQEVCDREDVEVQPLRSVPSTSTVKQEFLAKCAEKVGESGPKAVAFAKEHLAALGIPVDGSATDEQMQQAIGTLE